MTELSVLIPSRSEMFLQRTIQDILEHSEADTEIIAVLDGAWADPPIPQHERVNVIFVPEAIGQRAACNMAAKLARGKYLMKVDAHCSFAQGFDRVMLEYITPDVTMVPIMRNLWAFDWKCYHCGWKTYQGNTPKVCPDCGKADRIRRKMVWIAKEHPQSKSYCFDSEPHFQYFNEYCKRDEYKKMLDETGLTETMSLQGSCWMISKDKYFELNVCDESWGFWGSQGIEISMRTWLSGGKCLVNHNTYYAHLFRTKGSDFGFPYPLSGKQVSQTKEIARDTFFNNKWDKQIYPFSSVIERFWPIKGWSEEEYKALKLREMELDRPGIYSIKNTESGKAYIGSAVSLSRRFSEHLRMFRRIDHENDHLQKSWNKYGEDKFTFNVERFCDSQELIYYEQQYIDNYIELLGRDNLYNISLTAGSCLGHKHSQESLDKMSRQQSGEGNGFYGKAHTTESIEKMRASHSGCIAWNKGIDIVRRLGA